MTYDGSPFGVFKKFFVLLMQKKKHPICPGFDPTFNFLFYLDRFCSFPVMGTESGFVYFLSSLRFSEFLVASVSEAARVPLGSPCVAPISRCAVLPEPVAQRLCAFYADSCSPLTPYSEMRFPGGANFVTASTDSLEPRSGSLICLFLGICGDLRC